MQVYNPTIKTRREDMKIVYNRIKVQSLQCLCSLLCFVAPETAILLILPDSLPVCLYNKKSHVVPVCNLSKTHCDVNSQLEFICGVKEVI